MTGLGPLFQTQEDMALQIARMIVNEVNQATAQATPGGVDMQHCMVIDDSTLSANAKNIQTKTHN